jgi:hypothetical protein
LPDWLLHLNSSILQKVEIIWPLDVDSLRFNSIQFSRIHLSRESLTLICLEHCQDTFNGIYSRLSSRWSNNSVNPFGRSLQRIEWSNPSFASPSSQFILIFIIVFSSTAKEPHLYERATLWWKRHTFLEETHFYERTTLLWETCSEKIAAIECPVIHPGRQSVGLNHKMRC